MRKKFHVKRDNEVVVIAGSAKGRRGKIAQVLTKRDAVVLEANDERSKEKDEKKALIKPVLHHLRKSQQHPEGGLLWLEGPIHVSNVMLVTEYERRQAKGTAKASATGGNK
jgi:large subunit ribosomal protein L24